MDLVDSKSAAVAATALAGVASLLVARAVAAGKHAESSGASMVEARQVAGLKSFFSDRKFDIAAKLSEFLKLKTISYEGDDGKAASLIGLDGDAAAATSKRKKGCGGCACNCHAVNEAVGAPSSEKVNSGGGSVLPTPEALALSRADLLRFHALLEAKFPLMHSPGGPIRRHVVNELSLCYIWAGTNDETTKRKQGIGLAAHMDVVPVPDAAEWRWPPFEGRIVHLGADGKEVQSTDAPAYVVGRGAIDDKHSVIAVCEAVEHLLSIGYKPCVPYVVIAFGHDEELGAWVASTTAAAGAR